MSKAANARISEDLRYELADAARVAESGNKPRSLLVLATLLFLIAGVMLIVALRQRETAAGQLRLHAEFGARIDNFEAQFARVAEIRGSGNVRDSEPITDLFSRVEEAARTAGLQAKLTIPPKRETKDPQGAVRNLYEYKVQDPSLEHLLTWVEEARAGVPGLEVFSLEIAPAAKLWKFNVTFVRWERPS